MVVPPVAVPAAVAVDPRHDDRCISPIGYEFELVLDLLKEFRGSINFIIRWPILWICLEKNRETRQQSEKRHYSRTWPIYL